MSEEEEVHLPPDISIRCTTYIAGLATEFVVDPVAEDERILRFVVYSHLWPEPAKKELPYVSRPKIPFRSLPELNAWIDSQTLKDPFMQLPFAKPSTTILRDYLELVFVQCWQFRKLHYARVFWLGTVESTILKSNQQISIEEIVRNRVTLPPLLVEEEEEQPIEPASSPPQEETLTVSSSEEEEDVIDFQPMHKGQPSKFIYIFHPMREDELNRCCAICSSSYSFKLNERLMSSFPEGPHTEEKDMHQDAVLLHLWLYQYEIFPERKILAAIAANLRFFCLKKNRLALNPDESLFETFEETQSNRTRTLLESIGTDLDDLFLTARLNRLVLRHSELKQHESFVDYFVEVHSSGMKTYYAELRAKLNSAKDDAEDERESRLYLFMNQNKDSSKL